MIIIATLIFKLAHMVTSYRDKGIERRLPSIFILLVGHTIRKLYYRYFQFSVTNYILILCCTGFYQWFCILDIRLIEVSTQLLNSI